MKARYIRCQRVRGRSCEVSLITAIKKTVKEIALSDESEVIPICAGLEAEIAELALEEKQSFSAEWELRRAGLTAL